MFDNKKPYPRCDNRAKLLEHGCPESYIEDPQTKLEVDKVRRTLFHSLQHFEFRTRNCRTKEKT